MRCAPYTSLPRSSAKNHFTQHSVSISCLSLHVVLFPRLLCPELGVIIVRLKICSSVCRSSGNDRNKGLMLRSLE